MVSSRFRVVVSVLATAAVGLVLAGLNAPAEAASGRQLPGSVPSWAKASHRVAASDSSAPVAFRVYLDWRGGNAAAHYALAASTPGSARYTHFLRPQQFNAQFAPSTSTVNAVKSWLRSQGFSLGHVPSNRKYVEAAGTLAQAAKAFSTSFADFKVDGAVLRSNTTPLVIPRSLTGVEGILGLDESMALVHHDAKPNGNPPAVFNNATPCSTYWGEKTVTNTATHDGTVLPGSPARSRRAGTPVRSSRAPTG